MKYKVTKTISLIMVLILLMSTLLACRDADSHNKDEFSFLSPEKELEFKEIYSRTYDLEKEDLSINFWGQFNGAYAITVKTSTNDERSYICEVINGLDFVYCDTSPMTIVYSEKCYSLSQALEKNLITADELYTLFKRCKPVFVKDEFDFVDNTVVIRLMPSYNFKEYTAKDFSEINCIEVNDLYDNIEYEEGELCRFLVLKIKGTSKRNVIKSAEKLVQRDDVYSATPMYLEGNIS